MANVLIDENTLQDIANKARDLSGSDEPMTMSETSDNLGETKQTLDTTLEEIKTRTDVLSDNYQIEKLSKYLEYDEENDRYILDMEKQEKINEDGNISGYYFEKIIYSDIDGYIRIKYKENYIDSYNINSICLLGLYVNASCEDKHILASIIDLIEGYGGYYDKKLNEDPSIEWVTNITNQDIDDLNLRLKPGEIVKDENGNIKGEKFNNANEASGQYSHAEGDQTTASERFSHAEGSDTTASGESSHAEGGYTKASGNSSHSEGCNTTASGVYSHSEGFNTTASGERSHAEGYETTASGSGSHAEGFGTKASSPYQHVQGKYNIEDTEGKYAHIVGNGTVDANRSNAHTLDWNGNSEYKGDVIAKSPCDGTTSDEQVSLVNVYEKLNAHKNSFIPLSSIITEKDGEKCIDVSGNNPDFILKYDRVYYIDIDEFSYSDVIGIKLIGTNGESTFTLRARDFAIMFHNNGSSTDFSTIRRTGFISKIDGSNNIYEEFVSNKCILTRTNTEKYTPTKDYHPATKKYVDDNTKNLKEDGVIINSSTEGSSKKFKLTVDDSGNITATEVTE